MGEKNNMGDVNSTFVSKSDFKDTAEAKVLLIACSDFRFRKAFYEFQDKVLEDGGTDVINVPGGVISFFAERYNYPDTGKAAEFWTKFVAEKHKIKEIVLLGHEDCAAYVNAPKLENHGKEKLREEQTEDLLAAKQLIEDLLPDVKIKTYFASINKEEGKVSFSEVS